MKHDNKTIHTKNRVHLVKRDFTLGHMYMVFLRMCVFIRTTNKGFNFLDVKRQKIMFKRHIYSQQFTGREIPKYQQIFTFRIPEKMNKNVICVGNDNDWLPQQQYQKDIQQAVCQIMNKQ